MKHIIPLIVASFTLAIMTAMLQDGPFTLPYLAGFVMGIVVPVVVYSGILTLVVAGAWRLTMGHELPNLAVAMWGIWVLVAAVNFYGSYQNQQQRQDDLLLQSGAGWVQNDTQGAPTVSTLQARFVQDSRQLDTGLASRVAGVSIPPLFDVAFLENSSRFLAAKRQLEDYARLFEQHKETRRQLLANLKNEIEQLDLPSHEIRQAIQAFNNTYGIDEKLSERYLDSVIDVARKGIDFLEFMQQASYRVSDGRVLFETDAKSEEYQAFLQEFGRLSQQETVIQSELSDSREQRMERLRELKR